MKNHREAIWHNCLRLGWVRSIYSGRFGRVGTLNWMEPQYHNDIMSKSCPFRDPQKLLYVFVSKLFLKTIYLNSICQQNTHSFVFYIKAFDAKPYSFRALIAINGVLVMLWVHRKRIANKRVLLSKRLLLSELLYIKSS